MSAAVLRGASLQDVLQRATGQWHNALWLLATRATLAELRSGMDVRGFFGADVNQVADWYHGLPDHVRAACRVSWYLVYDQEIYETGSGAVHAASRAVLDLLDPLWKGRSA